MRRKTLGLIVGLLAGGCEDTLSPLQENPDQGTELRSARRSRNSSCDADAGSVDALVYVDARGYDAGRVDSGSGNDSDGSFYDQTRAEESIPPESSNPICPRASYALNPNTNDEHTFIYHRDSEGNILYTDSVDWSRTSSVGGVGGGDKETCYLTFGLPRGYDVFGIPSDFCLCIEGTGPEHPCPPSTLHPGQLQCGHGSEE